MARGAYGWRRMARRMAMLSLQQVAAQQTLRQLRPNGVDSVAVEKEINRSGVFTIR